MDPIEGAHPRDEAEILAAAEQLAEIEWQGLVDLTETVIASVHPAIGVGSRAAAS